MPDNSTLAGQAYKAIKERILDLRYSPGERLSEARMVQQLGLGRSPIRTALAQLKNDGWISVSPQSGTYVRSLGESEIRDLLDLRLLLEAHVARYAAINISADKLRKLRRSMERLCPRGIDNVDEDYFDEFNELDSLFHWTIYRAGGNALITDILMNLLDKVQWLKATAPSSTRRIKSSFKELEKILEALEARNPDAAARLMREHIENAADYAAEARRHIRQPEIATAVAKNIDSVAIPDSRRSRKIK